MSVLTETVLFIFGLVGLGYLTGLTGYLKVEAGEAIGQFAVGIALPLLLFRTMLSVDFGVAAPWGLWGTYFAAITVAWTAGHLVTTRIFGRDSRAGVVGGVSSAFSNLVLLGSPFMLGVFGEEGFEILSLLIAVHLPTMLMASILLFQFFGRSESEPVPPSAIVAEFLRKMLRNPLVVGILAGLCWRFSGFALPGLAQRFVDAFADIAAPLALFSMGLSLCRFGISGNVRPALALCGVKLVLMPAVALALVWAFSLPPLTAMVVVASAALPSGVNSYLIAVQFGTGQALASNQMTMATLLAAVTTTLWVGIAQALLA